MIDLLKRNGFDADCARTSSGKANTTYLSRNSIRQLLAELRTPVKRFRLSFGYMSESVISKTTGACDHEAR
jgi:hypothetical protein